MSPKRPSSTPPRSRVAAARQGPRIPLVAVVAVALVVVVAIVAVVLVVTGGDDGDVTAGPGDTAAPAVDQPFGPVTVEGTPLPPFTGATETDPAVGQAAPVLVGETPAGEEITVDPGDGPLVIAFLAHWCPHCQAEVPRIVSLADGADEIDGVPFVAVATGTNPQAPNYPPGAWLAEEEWPAPVLVDDETAAAAAAYGLSGYPYLVAVDADGTVVARSSGELGDDGLRAFFAAALAA